MKTVSTDQIREYKERIEKLARERYPQTGLLKQVKGVGTLMPARSIPAPVLAVLVCCLAGAINDRLAKWRGPRVGRGLVAAAVQVWSSAPVFSDTCRLFPPHVQLTWTRVRWSITFRAASRIGCWWRIEALPSLGELKVIFPKPIFLRITGILLLSFLTILRQEV